MASTERTGRIQRSAALVLALVLGGCATFSEDGGFGAVDQTARERLGKEVRWQRSDTDRDAVAQLVRERLARTLSVDDAVQVALVNNPGLQATYYELGIAEADLVQAGRLPNPRLASLRTTRGGEVSKIEQSIGFEVIGMLTMPLRQRVEARRFEAVQREVARNALAVASQAEKAYYGAVSAVQTVKYLEQVKASAEASAELARRMAAAGNFSKLAQMREHLFYAETVAQLARAQQLAIAERERLARLMGVSGVPGAFTLPDRLPELPSARPPARDFETEAMQARLDIQASRRETQALADSLGLTKTTRFINALEVGRARTREGDDPYAYGWEIALEIPLFDWGSARVARAESMYMQSVQRLADTALAARSEVREAYSSFATAYDTARHYRDEIVPLRKRISDENLLRYNGMLISVFELLADAREQVNAVNAYLDSLRDYWVADAELRAALTGAGEARGVMGAETPARDGHRMAVGGAMGAAPAH